MKTQCTDEQLEFHALGRRLVTGRFERDIELLFGQLVDDGHHDWIVGFGHGEKPYSSSSSQ